MKTDITSIQDIALIVNKQYDDLLKDPVTAPIFSHLSIKEHLPVIHTFWAFIVLGGEHSYRGNAFEKHVPLGLQEIHFEKWMNYLNNAIYSQFEGPNADKMWNQARLFETIFKAKLIKK
jgi:hemoglobin